MYVLLQTIYYYQNASYKFLNYKYSATSVYKIFAIDYKIYL